MEIQPDFRDLLELFNLNKVKYIVVGGYALAFHGAPRYTGDRSTRGRPLLLHFRQPVKIKVKKKGIFIVAKRVNNYELDIGLNLVL